MRIVQAAGWYLPSSTGGTEVYVSELSKRLRAAGHEVLIAAPEALGQDERTYDEDGFRVYRYPIPAHATRDEAQGRTAARGTERFHDWLRSVRPDVVHMHTYVTGLGLHELRVAKSLGARVIATTHAASLGFTCQRGTMMRWGTNLCDGIVGPMKCAACQLQHRGVARPLAVAAAMVPPSLGGLGRQIPGKVGTIIGMTNLITYNRNAQREMLDLVDRFVVLSEWARNVLLANGAPAEKVALNRLGVRFPADAAAGRRSLSPITVAYIGRFDLIKGVTDFARAIAMVPRSAPIRFEFHGPVQFRNEAAVLDRLKLIVGPDAWVTFGGELDESAVLSTLKRVDVICCPSRVVEGGPTIALEAQAAGVPVIGSAIPALSELVSDGVNGQLYQAGDTRALANVLASLAADPAIVDRWRQHLPPVRTMDEVTRDYLELVRSVSGAVPVSPVQEPPLSGVRRAVKQTLFSVRYYHQRLSQRAFDGIAVLCYHGVRATNAEVPPFSDLHVTADTFERHCRLIATACNPISLNDLRAARAGRQTLPRRPVLVTFDDGYRSVLDHALPILKRHRIPAVVFACASPIAQGRHFWFDAMGGSRGEHAVLEAREMPYHRWRTVTDAVALQAKFGELHRPLTLGELQALAHSPLIEIGGHTMSHPTLALAPIAQQQEEILGCRLALQDMIGKPVNAFAYPYGISSRDYGLDAVSATRDAGFDLAFTTCSTFAATTCDAFQIPRFVMLESVGEVELAHRLAHSWHVSEAIA